MHMYHNYDYHYDYHYYYFQFYLTDPFQALLYIGLGP